MEQNYLFIHKNHSQLFTIRTDTVDKKTYKNIMEHNVSNIIKSNKLSGGYSLVNLYNGIHEDFKINDNVLQTGGLVNEAPFLDIYINNNE
jgi:hypothetical protein